MQYEWETVLLSEINHEDQRFRITTATSNDAFEKSISELGLITTPIFVKKNQRYLIISGFRRISACIHLGWERIEVKVLPLSANDSACAKIAIAENSSQRNLNPIEQARALLLLESLLDDRQELLKVLKSYDLPANPKRALKISRLCHCLPNVQKALLEEVITVDMALELDDLAGQVATQLLELFISLRLGLNKQREILLYVKEIALREAIEMQEVLFAPSLQAIINDAETDRGAKAQKVRSYLRERRFPRLTAVKQNYERKVKALHLPPQMKLVPPKDFEGTKYVLSMEFNNHQELQSNKKAMDLLIDHPAMREILK